jgi:hypothetical protein
VQNVVAGFLIGGLPRSFFFPRKGDGYCPRVKLTCSEDGSGAGMITRCSTHRNAECRPAKVFRAFARGYRVKSILFALAAVTLMLSAGHAALGQSMQRGIYAFNRQNYVAASRSFIPLAERGNVSAQTRLGYMFETGRGVPQNYTEAAMWYRRAAEQGDSLAQYSLGLLYDRGQGVPRDIVEASKWLNLSAAAAPREAREARVRIRDAVTSKMTRGELAQARLRALEWAPSREH